MLAVAMEQLTRGDLRPRGDLNIERPLRRRNATSRLYADRGTYCICNSFAQLVDIDIAQLKRSSDNWSSGFATGMVFLVSLFVTMVALPVLAPVPALATVQFCCLALFLVLLSGGISRRGATSPIVFAPMLLWGAGLQTGVSFWRMSFQPCASPMDMAAIKSGVLLVMVAGHCYAIDADARVFTDPEFDAPHKVLRGFTARDLACVLELHQEDKAASYLRFW